MENKLEQLLNSLIKRGRVPFGYELLYPDTIEDCFDYDSRRKKCRFLIHKNFVDEVHNSLREIVSKESGLWQFVCENDLYPPYIQHRRFRDLPTNGLQIHDYRYWIIESALKDESELEDFLLSNIKVEGKND